MALTDLDGPTVNGWQGAAPHQKRPGQLSGESWGMVKLMLRLAGKVSRWQQIMNPTY